MKTNPSTVSGVTLCVSILLAGCPSPVPEIEKPNFSTETGGDGGSDELGNSLEDDGGDEGGGGGEIGPNTCLIYPEGSRYGYRHHCGGHMSFGFNGEADGHSVSKSYSYGFGPTYVEDEFEDVDTYDTPSVAACCGGPYDFDIQPSLQQTYFYNCKLDAVQQMCAAIPQWLIKLAEDYPVGVKGKLYDAAATLGDGNTQAQCVYALYEAGDNFNEIEDTTWDIAVGDSSLTVEVDLIEILEIDYPDPPETCYSIYENDENLLPLLTEKESSGLDILAQEHGDMGLSGANSFAATVRPDEGYAAVGRSYAGDVEIRSLLLRGTAPATVVVDGVGYTLDKWNLALIGPKQGYTHGSMTVFDAGETSFALSASYNGAVFRAGGTNTTAFTLQETATGWQLDGLELELDDGNGTVWSLRSASPLVFGP